MTLAALTLGLVGCSNDDDGDRIPESEGKNITILFDQKINPNTRAVDGSAIDGSAKGLKTTFSTGQLIFAQGDKVTKVYKIVADAEHSLETEKVSINKLTIGFGVTFEDVNATDVYVLGNHAISSVVVDSRISTSLLAAELKEAELRDGKFENAVLYGTSKVIEKAVTNNPKDGRSDYYANVTVAPLSARIELHKLSEKTDGGYTYKLEGIYINNYYEKMTVAGESKDLKTWLPSDYDEGSIPATYKDIVGSTSAADEFTAGDSKVWGYHTFQAKKLDGENNGLPRIIIHLKDVRRAKDDFQLFEDAYLNIISYGSTTEFNNGNVYYISDLKFDATVDLGITPDDSMIDCDVAIDVAAWIPNELKPDLNSDE